MKWVIVEDSHPNLISFLEGKKQIGIGTSAPVEFVKGISSRVDEIIILIPWIKTKPLPFSFGNIKIIPLRPLESISRLTSLGEAYKCLCKVIKKECPDLLYVGGYYAIPACFAARKYNKKIYCRFYGTFLSNLLLTQAKFSFKEIYNHYPKLLLELLAFKLAKNGIIITNDGTQGNIICEKLKIESNNVLYLFNGIDTDLLQQIKINTNKETIRAKYNIDNNHLLISNVSRLVSWKRVDLVIRAFAKFNYKYPNSKLALIGDGRLKDSLKKMCQYYHIENDVIFTDALARNDTLELLFSSNIITSFYEIGNIGNSVIESLCLGKVVLARDTGNTRQVIKNGETGYLLGKSEECLLNDFVNIASWLAEDKRRIVLLEKKVDIFAQQYFLSWTARIELEFKWIMQHAEIF
jgi:glycosyltransferase involved in cell wall biosynthesis